MKAVFDWLLDGLNEGRGQIITAIVLALLGCLRKFLPKVYIWCKQKFERLQETSREAEAKKVGEAKRKETQQQEQSKIKAENQSPALSDSEFAKLCREGDSEKVEEAIKNGSNVNAKDDKGNTVLILAAFEGYTKIAELLLQYGANINAKDDNGRTALSVARNVAIRKLLINAHDNTRNTVSKNFSQEATQWTSNNSQHSSSNTSAENSTSKTSSTAQLGFASPSTTTRKQTPTPSQSSRAFFRSSTQEASIR